MCSRHSVRISTTGLGLHALDGGDDQDCAVEHAQYPLYFGDKIGVAGRIDQS